MNNDVPAESLGAERLWELIQAGRALVAELDADRVIGQLLEVACRVTGARVAAGGGVGVGGVEEESSSERARFTPHGANDAARRELGAPPRGRGLLGLLMEAPQPFRPHDSGAPARSCGSPRGPPPMNGFLGVPIL